MIDGNNVDEMHSLGGSGSGSHGMVASPGFYRNDGDSSKRFRGRKKSEGEYSHASSFSQPENFSNVFDDGVDGGQYFKDLPMSQPTIGRPESVKVRRGPGRPPKKKRESQ